MALYKITFSDSLRSFEVGRSLRLSLLYIFEHISDRFSYAMNFKEYFLRAMFPIRLYSLSRYKKLVSELGTEERRHYCPWRVNCEPVAFPSHIPVSYQSLENSHSLLCRSVFLLFQVLSKGQIV